MRPISRLALCIKRTQKSDHLDMFVLLIIFALDFYFTAKIDVEKYRKIYLDENRD